MRLLMASFVCRGFLVLYESATTPKEIYPFYFIFFFFIFILFILPPHISIVQNRLLKSNRRWLTFWAIWVHITNLWYENANWIKRISKVRTLMTFMFCTLLDATGPSRCCYDFAVLQVTIKRLRFSLSLSLSLSSSLLLSFFFPLCLSSRQPWLLLLPLEYE